MRIVKLLLAGIILLGCGLAGSKTALAFEAEATLQIADSQDDYKESATGGCTRGATTQDLFTTSYLKQAYRFTDCPVPRGAVVFEARLLLYAYGSNYLGRDLDGTAWGEAADDAPVYVGDDHEITNAPKTQASAPVGGLPAWTEGVHEPVADVTAIIQEIVNRPGYAPGNAVKIFLVANSTSEFRRTRTFDSAPERGAILYLRYAVPPPPPAPPLAVIDAPGWVDAGQDAGFDAFGSSDADGFIVAWDWDFGDGSGASGETVTHAYAYPGDYLVTLTVTDDLGEIGQATHPIQVIAGGVETEVIFQIAAREDDYKETATGVSNRGDGTHDLWINGDIKQAFRFTGVSLPPCALITSAELQVYAVGTSYAGRDIYGLARGEATGNAPAWTGEDYEISNAPKTAAQVLVGGLPAWTVETHNPVADVTAIVQEIVDRPDWQENNALKIFLEADAFTEIGVFRRTRTYDSAPERAAKLVVRYLEAPDEPPVPSLPPLAALADPVCANVLQAVNLDASGSSDPDNDIAAYTWELGDGSDPVTTSTPLLAHTYDSQGVYEITLTVTDRQGNSDTDTARIAVAGHGANPDPDAFRVIPVWLVAADEPEPPAGWRAKLKNLWLMYQQYVAEQMHANGYGWQTFNLELESDGTPLIVLFRSERDSAWLTQYTAAAVQSEMEAYFGTEKATVALLSNYGPWIGGGDGRYGYAYAGKEPFLPYVGETVAEQLALFSDTSVVVEDPSASGWTVEAIAGGRLGGFLHETGHAFGMQHIGVPGSLMSTGMWSFHHYATGRGVVPYLTPGECLYLSQRANFNAATSYPDNTRPTLARPGFPPLAEVGQPYLLEALAADTGGAGLGVIEVYHDGVVAHYEELGGGDGPQLYQYSVIPTRVGTYPDGFAVSDRMSNRAPPLQIPFYAVASLPAIPPVPAPDPAETVYIEDEIKPDAIMYFLGWSWQSSIVAGGEAALIHPVVSNPQAPEQISRIGTYSNDYRLETNDGESLTVWVFIDPDGPQPDGIAIQWFGSAIGNQSSMAVWGADVFPMDYNGMIAAYKTVMGPLPPAGEWVRLEVPVTQLHLGGGDVRALVMSVSGQGTVIWDRWGKIPGG